MISKILFVILRHSKRHDNMKFSNIVSRKVEIEILALLFIFKMIEFLAVC